MVLFNILPNGANKIMLYVGKDEHSTSMLQKRGKIVANRAQPITFLDQFLGFASVPPEDRQTWPPVLMCIHRVLRQFFLNLKRWYQSHQFVLNRGPTFGLMLRRERKSRCSRTFQLQLIHTLNKFTRSRRHSLVLHFRHIVHFLKHFVIFIDNLCYEIENERTRGRI